VTQGGSEPLKWRQKGSKSLTNPKSGKIIPKFPNDRVISQVFTENLAGVT
jgi:hypothetical protein